MTEQIDPRSELRDIVEAVASVEREACAKVADDASNPDVAKKIRDRPPYQTPPLLDKWIGLVLAQRPGAPSE